MAWASIALLVVTGLYIASDRWGVGVADFLSGSGWFLRVLQVKVGMVAAIILMSLVHDFILGPRVLQQMEAVGEAGPPPERLRRDRRTLVWLARVNLLLILAVVVLAVTLTRGSPFGLAPPQ